MPADDTIEERLDKALTAVEWYSEAVKARAEVARLREALERHERGLAILYGTDRAAVAKVCDELIDTRGALLGRVRALSGGGQQ